MNFTELEIIKALKIGKVPKIGARRLCVGRDPEIAEFSRTLEFIAASGFDSRFLRGDYGSGKTFMCSVVRELAFEKRMLVSIVNLSREMPFGKRDLVIGEVLRGLRSPTSGTSSALDEVMQSWFGKYEPGLPLDQHQALDHAIKNISVGDAGLAMGLRGYYRAFCEGDEAAMQAVLGWLGGDAMEAELRRQTRVVGKLTPEAAFRRLRGLCALMRDAEYPGLVILVDEIESIMRLAKPQRDAAYTAMREIIDIGSEEFPYTFFLFAGTQVLFEDEFKGVASYQALYQRIRSQQVASGRDLRQPIIRLEEFGSDSLTDVSRHVREVHGLAYEWDAVGAFTDSDLAKFVAEAGAKFGKISQKPRAFLKAIVDTLDARNQHLDIGDDVVLEAAANVERADATLDDFVEAVA